jgi:hypothetical protein
MAKILSQIPIETGNTIEAWHVTQSIDAFTGIEAYDISLSGSFNLTGSLTLSGLSTSPQSNVLTVNPSNGNISYTSSNDITVKTASTASYVNLNAGTNITINKVGTAYYISGSGGSTGDFVTTSSFNSFTSSYTTGSFTGSFTGNLTGTASYVNLKAGPNIIINQNGSTFAISGSTPSTGSFLTTASISSNTITFTKGDNSTFPINLPSNGATTWYATPTGTAPDTQLPPGNYGIILNYGTTPHVPYLYLPTSSCSTGDTIQVVYSSSGYEIKQTSGQSIIGDGNSTTVGSSGQLTVGVGSITLVCINPNLTWACTKWSSGIVPDLTFI